MKNCRYCTREFVPEEPREVYCCNTCRDTARKFKKKESARRAYIEAKFKAARAVARAEVAPKQRRVRFYRASSLALAGDTPARDAEYRENALTGICGAVFTTESLWGRW